ncbi:MAG: glycosyltransferase family 4 protein [Deltaproteobacteria bacterium]|nr:glycosyltransferase family 4 protein [Deltaproteobacteria bacterium]
MINVLHVLNGFEPGGVETQLLRILQGYDREKFHMDACIVGDRAGELAEDARQFGAKLFFCAKSPNLISFSRRIAAILENRDYHIVHSHFEGWSGAILRGARRAGVRVRVAQVHGFRAWPAQVDDALLLRSVRSAVSFWGRHWLRRYATHILAVSEAVARKRRLDRLGGPPVVLWTGGVDTETFCPDNTDTRAQPARPVILWVGALREVKRVDLHLQILLFVRKEVPQARLVLAGTGAQEGTLRNMAGHMGISDAVDFLGMRRDVPDLLRSAAVFVSCSEAEGLPTALLEAQAAGTPVVASDIDSHREALSEALHPYLFRHNDIRTAARNVIQLLNDPELRAGLGEKCRRFVEGRYDFRRQLGLLQTHYEDWVAAAKEHRAC